MAFCTECGTPNRPGARYCRSCGAQMEILEEEMDALLPPSSTPPAASHKAEGTAQDQPDAGEEFITLPGRALPDVEPNAVDPNADTVRIFPAVSSGAASAPVSPGAGAEEAVPEAHPLDVPVDIGPFSEPAGPADQPAPVEYSENTAGDGFAPGVLVGGRYRLRAVLTNLEGSLTCDAEDVLTCWSCSAIQPQPGLRYCETCGAELSHWQQVALVELTASGQPPVSSDQLVQHQGKIFRVEAAQADSLPASTSALRFQAGQRTDSGTIRDMNEDSLVAYQLTALCENQPAPQLQFFAVADGIGGSDAGEVASRTAVRALIEELHRLVVQPLMSGELLLVESLGEHLREIVRHANRQILEKRQERSQDMGCTLTAVLFYGADGVIANVGDSRTYLFRAGKLAQVSTDHSVVANLVAGGVIKPEEAYYHDQRNVILRSLGDKPELEVDLFPVRAQPGDRYLLCSDGLWEMVRDNIIEDVLLELPDPQAACARLVEYANTSGGEDNISVILVDVHAL